GINDHAVAHDADDVGPQDAGGQQVQNELAPLVLDGVAGVVAALVADHDIVILAEQVDHAALALVAPVDPSDCSKHNDDLFIERKTAFSVHLARDALPAHTNLL